MIRESIESGSRKFGMCVPQAGGDDYSDIGKNKLIDVITLVLVLIKIYLYMWSLLLTRNKLPVWNSSNLKPCLFNQENH